MKRALAVVGAALLLLLAYLFFWPVPYEPTAWVLPREVPAKLNDALAHVTLEHGELPGPEAIAFEPGADGGLVTGLRDGRIVRITAGQVETLRKGGRALGLKYAPDGRLWICDSEDGLMAQAADGGFEKIATPARFADDLDFGDDGAVYFSEASQKNDLDHYVEDLVEHQLTGRLLRWKDGQTTVVADGFSFANGVSFGPSRDWLLLAETGGYRLWKIGVRDGKREVFADLPGFPDNITWSNERQIFWVAIGSPRDPGIDALAGSPFVRKLIFRLPKALRPKPKRHAWVLGYDATGALKYDLQYAAPDAYSPIASATEHDGQLYLGSFLIDGYARYALP